MPSSPPVIKTNGISFQETPLPTGVLWTPESGEPVDLVSWISQNREAVLAAVRSKGLVVIPEIHFDPETASDQAHGIFPIFGSITTGTEIEARYRNEAPHTDSCGPAVQILVTHPNYPRTTETCYAPLEEWLRVIIDERSLLRGLMRRPEGYSPRALWNWFTREIFPYLPPGSLPLISFLGLSMKIRIIAAAGRFCDQAITLRDQLSEEALEKIANFEIMTRKRLLASPKLYPHPWAQYPSGAVLLNNVENVHFRAEPSKGGETLFRSYLVEPALEKTVLTLLERTRS